MFEYGDFAEHKRFQQQRQSTGITVQWTRKRSLLRAKRWQISEEFEILQRTASSNQESRCKFGQFYSFHSKNKKRKKTETQNIDLLQQASCCS